MKQAVILAGGKGTRLQERLQGLPKPLIDICGTPLLERQIELLKHYGYKQILILVNHGAEQMIDFCHKKQNWGLDIQCIDDGKPLGTAGAVIAIYPKLADEFLVVYGDTMFDVNLDRFEAFHQECTQAGASLFLHPNDHPFDSDLVDMDEQYQITSFYPYPHQPNQYWRNLVNAGMYFFRKAALQGLLGNESMFDFGKDVFPTLLAKGVLLRGYNSFEYIKDCGTPKRLDKVCADYATGLISASNLSHQQKIVFLDRDGTINRLVDQLSKAEQFELLPGVANAISKLNKSFYRAVLVTNQPVIARGECSQEDLVEIHKKMETLLGEHGAYLNHIYFCPHHPDQGFMGEVKEFKIKCDCRKPGIGMLRQAKQDLNANLASSWMIGDSSADMAAANKAGIHSIILETGNAGMDEKYPAIADFSCPNLDTAVDFILHKYPTLLERCQHWALGISPGDIVLIGGLSRSGKSTLATALKDALQLNGLNAAIFHLDGWLKPMLSRGNTVLERYDLGMINRMLQRLVRNDGVLSIAQPVYSKLLQQSSFSIEKNISTQDVLILEGTIALELVNILNELENNSQISRKVHSCYVDIDESLRKKRVIQEYELRGKGSQEANQIYERRQTDESPFVLRSKSSAQLVIELPY
jgi:histidinol-phosphate phosphatase family protein